MTSFAGYQMPLHYPTGIIKEHQHTRKAASLFDVSHMGQISLQGTKSPTCIETTTPIDVVSLMPNRQRYGFLTNSAGGIVDDFILMNTNCSEYRLIVNAANVSVDLKRLSAACRNNCGIEHLRAQSLLALQGPLAATSLARFVPECLEMAFMDVRTVQICGATCVISRSGYTGEDGYEISLHSRHVDKVARALLRLPEVRPAGLGARDSLRLEAGLCLHGNDIDEDTSPVEADIAWAIPRSRRIGGAREGGFPGADVILDQLIYGAQRRRVGIQPEGRTPVRPNAVLETSEGNIAGAVTSGGFSHSLSKPISMGYVNSSLATPETVLQATVRNKQIPVIVKNLPFTQLRYRRT